MDQRELRFRFAVYLLCVFVIMTGADLVSPAGQLRTFLDYFRAVVTVSLWIAALYFGRRAWPLAFRIQEEREARISTKDGPISLGLNGNWDNFLKQADSYVL